LAWGFAVPGAFAAADGGPDPGTDGHQGHEATPSPDPGLESALPALRMFSPCFKGSLSVGSTITTVLGPIESELGTVHIDYQWLRDGEEIPGATDKSYTLTEREAGASVSVRITASKPGYATEVKISCTRKISANPQAIKARAVKLTGRAKVGSTIRVKGASWGKGVKMQYRWTCDHDTFKVTAKASLTLTRDHAGCRISVAVRGYAKDKASAVLVTNHPEVEGLAMTVPQPQIFQVADGVLVAADFPKAGTILRGVIDPAPAYPDFAVDWQWLRDGQPIIGATEEAFTVSWGDAGKSISVSATATATGHEPVAATSTVLPVQEVVQPAVPPGETHRPRGS
jgi:hypothetical protein